MGRFQPRTPDFLRLPLLQHLFVLVHAPHLPQVDASTWTDVQSLARLIARVRLLVSCAPPVSDPVISTDLSLCNCPSAAPGHNGRPPRHRIGVAPGTPCKDTDTPISPASTQVLITLIALYTLAARRGGPLSPRFVCRYPPALLLMIRIVGCYCHLFISLHQEAGTQRSATT